jgi:hypothetical protein
VDTNPRAKTCRLATQIRSARSKRELRGQSDVDHVRKLQLAPRTHIHVSDLRLFVSKIRLVRKSAGHRRGGSRPSRTRTLWAWHDAASLKTASAILRRSHPYIRRPRLSRRRGAATQWRISTNSSTPPAPSSGYPGSVISTNHGVPAKVSYSSGRNPARWFISCAQCTSRSRPNTSVSGAATRPRTGSMTRPSREVRTPPTGLA